MTQGSYTAGDGGLEDAPVGTFGTARCRRCGEPFPLWVLGAATCPACMDVFRQVSWSAPDGEKQKALSERTKRLRARIWRICPDDCDYPGDYPDLGVELELREALLPQVAEEEDGWLEIVVDGTLRGQVGRQRAEDLCESLMAHLGMRPDVAIAARDGLMYHQAMTLLMTAEPWTAHISREPGHRIGGGETRCEQWCIVCSDDRVPVIFFSEKVRRETGLRNCELSMLQLAHAAEDAVFDADDLAADDWYIRPGVGVAEDSRLTDAVDIYGFRPAKEAERWGPCRTGYSTCSARRGGR